MRDENADSMGYFSCKKKYQPNKNYLYEISMATIFSTHRRMIKGLEELDNAKKTMSFIVISSH
ncbi:MAG: hypothetical protein K9I29_00750 [Bacteroidales bacterium]|nr:hypothetical protein [Bacteroidales bacterium]